MLKHAQIKPSMIPIAAKVIVASIKHKTLRAADARKGCVHLPVDGDDGEAARPRRG